MTSVAVAVVVPCYMPLLLAMLLMLVKYLFCSMYYTIFLVKIKTIVNKQAVSGRPPRYASASCKLTISSYLFASWHLFRHVGYLRHHFQGQKIKGQHLWSFDLESDVHVKNVHWLPLCQF